MGSNVGPFLGGGAPLTQAVIRSLASALPAAPAVETTSPWLPRAAPAASASGGAPALPAAPQLDPAMIAAAKEAAEFEGYEAGMQATAELRDKLAAAIAACERAAAIRVEAQAERLADAAVTVIESWLGRALPDADRFAPIVRGWLAAGTGGAATATVNPADAAALRDALGDAKLAVVEDKAMARGDIKIVSSSLEIDHAWSARLDELRTAIATAFAQVPPAPEAA
jgi:flagellar biosynthesis/type III secretory pathway protein FliH|nr:FliH/SctL family protein [Kofleriaceae bacterium]